METNQTFNLDTSLGDVDKVISKEDYIEKIVKLLEPILQHRFYEELSKQKIRVFRDRINCACPYCGDSMQDKYAKRGNVILEGKHKNHYKCFNCGTFRRVDDFLKDYNVIADLDIINFIALDPIDFHNYQSNSKYDVSLLLDIEYIEKFALDRSELIEKMKLVEAKDSDIKHYLHKRLQFDMSKFLWSPKNYLIILNNTPNGKVIGFQIRKFDGSKNKYMTYKLSKIYELLGKDKTLIDQDTDDVSCLYGLFNVAFNKPITLFEGPLDAFLFKNSIANTGANKDFPMDIPIQYFYDNDATGRKKALEKINSGSKVFLWSKFLDSISAPVRPKWDLNDVIIYMKEHNMKIPNLYEYFSNDVFDMIDL